MVARGAAKQLTKKELELCTVRQLMEVARRAGAVVPPGTTKQPLIDLLSKAKVTGAHLADPADSSDASDGSHDDSDGSQAGSDSSDSSAYDHQAAKKIPTSHATATSKKSKKSKKHTDSDSDDDDADEEDEDSPFAVISRHTGIPTRTLRRTPKNWGEMDVVLSPILWIYMFVTHPVKFTALRKTGSLLPGSLFRGVVLMLEMRFPNAPKGFIAQVMNDLCAAHDLCTAAVISCQSLVTKGFDWGVFLRLHGNTVARWSERISEQTDADIVTSFGDATAAILRAQRRVCESSLPVGQKEILQKALKKRRLEDSSVAGDGKRSADNSFTTSTTGRRCRRCRMVVTGPFSAHNKKGVCPKKK
jgi:hypothetical protein